MKNCGTLRQFLNLPPLTPQICYSAGGRGGPQLFCFIGILIFLLLRSPCKYLKPYNKPYWDFSNGGTRVRQRLIPKIVAYLSFLRWSHALRSFQFIFPWSSSMWLVEASESNIDYSPIIYSESCAQHFCYLIEVLKIFSKTINIVKSKGRLQKKEIVPALATRLKIVSLRSRCLLEKAKEQAGAEQCQAQASCAC